MYVISLDKNQKLFEDSEFERLEHAITYAMSLNENNLDYFTVGVLQPITEFLDNFEDQFINEFIDPIELFFMDRIGDTIDSDVFNIDYKDTSDTETFLRHFFRDYKDNLNIKPKHVIKKVFKLPFKNANLIYEIKSFIFLQVPNTHTMVCNFQLNSGRNVAGISYEVLNETGCKLAAYDNGIYNLLKEE